MDNLPAYVKILAYLFVVVYMLSVPLETTRGEIVATLRDFRLMGYALLANLIIIPVLSVILARLFDLPLEMRTGFLMLALAPGGLLGLQFARVSKGNRVLAVGLLVVLTLVAIVVTPVLMSLFFPPSEAGKMPFAWFMILLILISIVPLLIGLDWQQRAPAAAPKLGRLLGVLSIVLFIIATLAAGKYKTPTLKSIGLGGIVAIIVLILCAWAVGWLLGGPEIRNRKVLAIGTSMRNVGVCYSIAAHYFPGTDVVVPILAFSVISIPMNMLFALITGRMRRDTEVSTRPVEA